MRRGQVWTWAIAQLRSLATLKHLPGVLAIVLCLVLSTRWLPAYAGSDISSQLKEQVLQIIRENPEVILEAVRSYQQKQQAAQQQARQSFLQSFKSNPSAIVGQSPRRGARNGRVLLIEFSDFQCPFCSKAHDTLKEFVAKYGDTVTLVYKHLPLTSIHPEALPAAKAAWAAGQQGKFWEFHDALFANQKQLSDTFYQATAKSLGLDMQRFNRDRASSAADTAIEQDVAIAEKLGVDGTPFFVMNGEVLTGAVELADLEKALAKVRK